MKLFVINDQGFIIFFMIVLFSVLPCIHRRNVVQAVVETLKLTQITTVWWKFVLHGSFHVFFFCSVIIKSSFEPIRLNLLKANVLPRWVTLKTVSVSATWHWLWVQSIQLWSECKNQPQLSANHYQRSLGWSTKYQHSSFPSKKTIFGSVRTL